MFRALIIILIAIGAALLASFITYERLKSYINEHKPDPAMIEASLDSLYVALSPISVEQGELGVGQVRCDRLLFDRKTSLVRVNLEITRCVERSGGEIAYGLDSLDAQKKKQYVTLGISDGKTLLRQVILEKKLK